MFRPQLCPLPLAPRRAGFNFPSAGEEACVCLLGLWTGGRGGHEQDTVLSLQAVLPWTWVNCQPCFLSLEQDFKVPNLTSSPGWRRGKSPGPQTHRELRKAGSGVVGVKVSLGNATVLSRPCWQVLPLCQAPLCELWTTSLSRQNFAFPPLHFSLSFPSVLYPYMSSRFPYPTKCSSNPRKELRYLSGAAGCLPVASVPPSPSQALLASSALAAWKDHPDTCPLPRLTPAIARSESPG